MNPSEARIVVSPELTADELFGFYKRNNICEVGVGTEVAARILDHPHVMVAAFAGEELVGLARATFDGLSAALMELSLDVRWQGRGQDTNGSLMEGDRFGVGARLGCALLAELERLGSDVRERLRRRASRGAVLHVNWLHPERRSPRVHHRPAAVRAAK